MPRKRKGNRREEIYHQLHNNIDFSIVAHFFQVHKQLFNLERIFSKQKLAEELIAEEISDEFEADIVRFLRFLTDSKDIDASNWEEITEDQLDLIGVTDSPLLEVDFADLSRERKAKVLKQLVDVALQFRREELQLFKTKSTELGEPTFEPIGRDKDGNRYWYFGDTKLYREYAKERKGWDICCSSQDQWIAIMDSLKRVNDKSVKELFHHLKSNVWPDVEAKFQENAVLQGTDGKVKNAKRQRVKKKSPADEGMHLWNGNSSSGYRSSESDSEHPAADAVKEPKKKAVARNSISNGGDREDVVEEKELVRDRGESPKVMKQRAPSSSSPAAENARSDSPGIDLSVFEPRSKRRCVLALEKKKDAGKDWWDGDDELAEASDDNVEDEEDGDYNSGDDSKIVDASHRRRLLPGKSQKRKEERPVPMAPPNRMYAFSTVLANRAAVAIARGSFDSIISFHRAQQWDGPYLTAEKHCRQPAKAPVITTSVIASAPTTNTAATLNETPRETRRPIDDAVPSADVKRPFMKATDDAAARTVFPNGSRVPPVSLTLQQQQLSSSFPPHGLRERELSMDEWQGMQIMQSLRQTSPQAAVRSDLHPFMYNMGYGHGPNSSPFYERPPMFGASPHEFERMPRSLQARFLNPYDTIAAQQRYAVKDSPAYSASMAAAKFGKGEFRPEYASHAARAALTSAIGDASVQRASPLASSKTETDKLRAGCDGLSKARTPDVPFPFDTSQQLRPNATGSPPSSRSVSRSSSDSPHPVYMDLSNSRAPSSAASSLTRHTIAPPPPLMTSLDRSNQSAAKQDGPVSVIQVASPMRKSSSPSAGDMPFTSSSRSRYSPSGKTVDVASFAARRPHPLASQAGQNMMATQQFSRGQSPQSFTNTDPKAQSRTSFSVESLAAPTFRSESSAFQQPRAMYPGPGGPFPYPPGAFPSFHRLPPGYMPQVPQHLEQYYHGRTTNAPFVSPPPRNVNGR